MATVEDIARGCGVTVRTVQRWVSEGCPTLKRGRKGGGGATVLDLDQVRAWRESKKDADSTAAVLEVATLLPDLLADAVEQAARDDTGPHKLALHGALAEAWHRTALRFLEALRQRYPDAAHLIRDPVSAPDAIWRMAQVNRHQNVDS